MAFYHYLPVPMDDKWGNEGSRGFKLLLVAGVLLVVSLSIALGFFIIRASSEACQDGLRAESKCQNVTHLLQSQLKRAQDGLLEAETRAATCNQTVGSLLASLEQKNSQEQKQRVQIQKLQGENVQLNRTLQITLAELEQVRKEKAKESRPSESSSAGSLAASCFLVPAVLLLLLGGLG